MNANIANSLFGYIQTLYLLNKKLIKLCGVNVCDHSESYENEILDIIQDIPRLIPYSYDKKNKILVNKDKDGLLEYKDEIKYIKNDYETLLKKNYNFLDRIRLIRNKYEHKMHDILIISSGSGSTTLFDFEFQIDGKTIEVYAGEFISLVKQLNLLFSKIIDDIVGYAYDNNKSDYLYYRRIEKINFTDFNLIYESDLLRKICQCYMTVKSCIY